MEHPTATPDEPTRVSPIFEQHIVAGDDDVDQLRHVSNLAYVRWVFEVAKAHSEHVGWDVQRYLDLGAAFVVRRHEIDYLKPTYAGDGIVLRTWVENFKGATSVRRTQLFRAGDKVELARAKTTWALVSIIDGRPRRIPAELRDDFSSPADRHG